MIQMPESDRFYFIPKVSIKTPLQAGMGVLDVMQLHAELIANEILYRARRGEATAVENVDSTYTVYDPRLPEHYRR